MYYFLLRFSHIVSMDFSKGQSAIEYFMILSIGILIASPFALLVQQDIMNLQTGSSDTRFAASLEDMQNAVERADALGEPASTTFTLKLPQGIINSSIQDQFVIFTQNRSGIPSNMTVKMDADIRGNLPEEKGNYQGKAEAWDEQVNISFKNWP